MCAKVDFQLILWESICFAHSIAEDISAVFAKVNARLMGGMINYCGYLRKLAFGKHTYANSKTAK